MFFSFIEIVLASIYFVTLYYAIFWLLVILESPLEKNRRLGRLPSVTVVVPAFNEEENISMTAQSVLGLMYPQDRLQLIVVNDGSTDATLLRIHEFALTHADRNIVVINQQNHGKYEALNKALARATGEFFVCLDADSLVERDALRKMLPYFTSEKVGVVIPMLKVANPKNLLQKIQWYEYLINKFYNKMISRLNCLHVAPGPFSVYRAAVLRKLGGFRKGHNTEDLEIALRLQKHHYELIQMTEAEVTTIAPHNLKELYAQRNRWNRGSFLNVLDSRNILFNRSYGDFGMFYLPLVMASGFIVSVLVAITFYYQLIKPAYKTIYNLSLVNFDVLTYLRHMAFNLSWLDVDYYKLALMLFVLVITGVVVVLAHRMAHERIAAKGLFPLIAGVMFYYLLLGIVWMGVFKDLILKKWQRW